MSVQILNDPGQWGSFGANLGVGLGSGLSQTLGLLAQIKINNLVQQQEQAKLGKALQYLGLTPDKAQGLSQLPSGMQSVYLKQILQEPQNQAYAQALGSLLGGSTPEANMGTSGLSALSGLGGLPGLQGGMQLTGGQLPTRQIPTATTGLSIPAGLNQQQATKLTELVLGERNRTAKLSEQEKQFQFAKVLPRLEKLAEREQQLTSNLSNFKRLSALNQEGAQPGVFGTQYFTGEKGQLFNSLVESLIPEGASKAELESHRKRFPSLSQSPTVRQKLIDSNIEKITGDLERVNKQYSALSRKFLPQQQNVEATSPYGKQETGIDSRAVHDTILGQSLGQGATPIQSIGQTQNPIARAQTANQLTQQNQPTQNQFANQQPAPSQAQGGFGLSDLGYLGAKAVQGAGEGIVGTAALPFHAANLLSLGHIPVPEVVSQIEDLPRKSIEAVVGELTPSSEGMKWAGQFVSDVASFLTPGAALGKIGKAAKLAKLESAGKILGLSPRSAATLSAVKNLSKWGVERAGYGPKEQAIVSGASMLAVPILGSRLLNYKIDSLSKDAANLITGETIKAPELQGALGHFYTDLTKGAPSAVKSQLMQDLSPILDNLKAGGVLTGEELLNLDRAFIKTAANPDARHIKTLGIYSGKVSKALENMGKKAPEFGQVYGEIKDLSKAASTSNVLTEFARNHLGSRAKNPLVYGILGLGLAKATGLPLYKGLGAAGAIGLPIAEAQRVLTMSLKSPAFRKYYGQLALSATKGSVQEFNKAATNLEKVVSKFENEEE